VRYNTQTDRDPHRDTQPVKTAEKRSDVLELRSASLSGGVEDRLQPVRKNDRGNTVQYWNTEQQ